MALVFIPSGESIFFKASMTVRGLAKRRAGSQTSRHGGYLSDLLVPRVQIYVHLQGSVREQDGINHFR